MGSSQRSGDEESVSPPNLLRPAAHRDARRAPAGARNLAVHGTARLGGAGPLIDRRASYTDPGALSVTTDFVPNTVERFRLEDSYVMGVPFKEYMGPSSLVHPTSNTATFRQNPTEYISAIATSGDYVAIGERTGRVSVMRRKPISAAQRHAMAAMEQNEEHYRATADAALPPPRTQDTYDFHVSQYAYTSVIDPLNNVEVTPNVTAMSFLSQVSSVPFLLTANEKVPKLYKIFPSVRESVEPFKMVDQLEASSVGPLTAPSRGSTVAMKMVTKYALNHEYNINSLCPLSDSEQFVSADDLTMQLWCTEYPDMCIETYNLRPSGEEEAREAIRTVRNFPHEPFLLFVATSAGNVRVIDMRQSLKWINQAPQIFFNPPREADGTFDHVTHSLCDCALSPCSRYIAGRDFMTVCLWDVRSATGGSATMAASSPRRKRDSFLPDSNSFQPVRVWELHPHLRDDFETLYQSDLLFERFDIAFLNRTHVGTGGFSSSLYTIDVTAGNTSSGFFSADAPVGVRQMQLPTVDGTAAGGRKGSLKMRTADGKGADTPRTQKSSMLELGSRLTLLSRPTASFGGRCELLATCGQVLMQVSYSAL
ncbi:protein phosphatase 2 (formerly 2A), regulatory subunit B [Strigomonas culicis]|uniref:Protein phosphatase 2 (Formerly 2A), regulatory subunit B n=1 Tax=Strigomonas culicis TaxID=28005 RepID=S9TLH9_9TRYP|nr:protein phosphatase 2 (formerly 2A), regulatory subunit B [Strigomonas culicis]|eukprot:EPY19062.1 protein phosphatase 2 (formerly 2A), regulatory subunit B [Strigomonas culicis]